MFKPPDWYFGARRVIAFPRLGIVVKVPRVYWMRGLWQFVIWYRCKGVIFSLHWNEDQVGNCRYFWTKGLRDNWKEFVFFWRYRKPFLQPTIFSLFGFVNIQLYGRILNEEEFEKAGVWKQFLSITDEDVYDDNHHFFNPANFCISEDGHLRIVDYGSPATRTILLKWADKLEDVSLDPVQE